jgi:hypothetical protein
MRDWGFPDVFTLPTDAGPNDDRIVVDSINGRIEIYEGPDLVGVFKSGQTGTPTTEPGLFIFEPGSSDDYIGIQLLGGIPNLVFNTSDVAQSGPGGLFHFLTSALATRAFDLTIDTANFVGRSAAVLELISERQDGSFPADIGFNGNSLPRGISGLPRFTSQADGALLSADSVTDMVLSNVPHISGHLYRFYLHSEVTFADLGTTGRWIIVLRDGSGTVVGRFCNLMFAVGGTLQTDINAWVEWEAPSNGTEDFDVFADEVAGASTIQFRASAVSERYLTVEHVGEA